MYIHYTLYIIYIHYTRLSLSKEIISLFIFEFVIAVCWDCSANILYIIVLILYPLMLKLFFSFRLSLEMSEVNESQEMRFQADEHSQQEQIEGEDVPNTIRSHELEYDGGVPMQSDSPPASQNLELNALALVISAPDGIQEFMQRSDFSPDFYDAAMAKVVACERDAAQLHRSYNFYIGKLRTAASLCMDSQQAQCGHLLKAALAGLKLTRNTSRALLLDINKFGQIALDQHKLIRDTKDELDQVGRQLGEQQRINKELERDLDDAHRIVEEESLVQLHEQMQLLQDENKSLADTVDLLQSSHPAYDIVLAQQSNEDEAAAAAAVASDQVADIEIYVLDENYTDGEAAFSDNDAEEEGHNTEEVEWDETNIGTEVTLHSLLIGEAEE